MAFNELVAAARLVDCRGGVWRDLERAAQLMDLRDRIPELRERFASAPVGDKPANNE